MYSAIKLNSLATAFPILVNKASGNGDLSVLERIWIERMIKWVEEGSLETHLFRGT